VVLGQHFVVFWTGKLKDWLRFWVLSQVFSCSRVSFGVVFVEAVLFALDATREPVEADFFGGITNFPMESRLFHSFRREIARRTKPL